MSKYLTENDKKVIVEEKFKGTSSRKIGKIISRGKSTINDYWNRITKESGMINANPPEGAKVLFVDLEVSASIVAAFSMFKHFSTPDHIIQFPYVLSYACNWLHEPEDVIECYGLNDFDKFKSDPKDDYELILRLWKWFDEADIVVAHNARFDVQWFNMRCAMYQIPEPSPFRIICTLKGLKRSMALPSNSLNYSTKYFALEHSKLHHEGISLWIRCMDGKVEALEKMKDYNRGDIPTLRSLYLTIRSYIPNHPNISLYYDQKEGGGKRCSVCGSHDLIKLDSKAYTNLNAFTSYRCGNCGTVKRSNESAVTKEMRNDMMRNLTR